MTRPVRIPADVNRPDRVLGPLTARQVVLLAVPASVLYVAWSLLRGLVPLPVFAAIAVPVAALAVAVALGHRDGLPLDRFLLAALHHHLRCRLHRHQAGAPLDPAHSPASAGMAADARPTRAVRRGTRRERRARPGPLATATTRRSGTRPDHRRGVGSGRRGAGGDRGAVHDQPRAAHPDRTGRPGRRVRPLPAHHHRLGPVPDPHHPPRPARAPADPARAGPRAAASRAGRRRRRAPRPPRRADPPARRARHHPGDDGQESAARVAGAADAADPARTPPSRRRGTVASTPGRRRRVPRTPGRRRGRAVGRADHHAAHRLVEPALRRGPPQRPSGHRRSDTGNAPAPPRPPPRGGDVEPIVFAATTTPACPTRPDPRGARAAKPSRRIESSVPTASTTVPTTGSTTGSTTISTTHTGRRKIHGRTPRRRQPIPGRSCPRTPDMTSDPRSVTAVGRRRSTSACSMTRYQSRTPIGSPARTGIWSWPSSPTSSPSRATSRSRLISVTTTAQGGGVDEPAAVARPTQPTQPTTRPTGSQWRESGAGVAAAGGRARRPGGRCRLCARRRRLRHHIGDDRLPAGDVAGLAGTVDGVAVPGRGQRARRRPRPGHRRQPAATPARPVGVGAALGHRARPVA